MSLPLEQGNTEIPERVRELRRDFDRGFAAPPRADAEQKESLLAIRVAGRPFAVRTLEIGGLARRARIVPVPGDCPELLGITAVRGTLLAVYDLVRLLGLQTAAGEPSWLLLANAEAPVALAFDHFESRLEVARECIFVNEESKTRDCARQLLRRGAEVRPVIDMAAVVETVRQRAGRRAASGSEE